MGKVGVLGPYRELQAQKQDPLHDGKIRYDVGRKQGGYK